MTLVLSCHPPPYLSHEIFLVNFLLPPKERSNSPIPACGRVSFSLLKGSFSRSFWDRIKVPSPTIFSLASSLRYERMSMPPPPLCLRRFFPPKWISFFDAMPLRRFCFVRFIIPRCGALFPLPMWGNSVSLICFWNEGFPSLSDFFSPAGLLVVCYPPGLHSPDMSPLFL